MRNRIRWSDCYDRLKLFVNYISFTQLGMQISSQEPIKKLKGLITDFMLIVTYLGLVAIFFSDTYEFI